MSKRKFFVDRSEMVDLIERESAIGVKCGDKLLEAVCDNILEKMFLLKTLVVEDDSDLETFVIGGVDDGEK